MFDDRGHLILCQTYFKRVISIDVATKAIEVLADKYQFDNSPMTNKPFNGPFCPKVDRNGGLYFTDCNGHCQDSSAVYYLSADKGVKRVIGAKSAWGITVAEDTLFLVDQNEIWAYSIIGTGEIDRHGKKIFSCGEDIWDLAMDAHGNLYLTHPTAKYIDVISSSGLWLGKINFPDYTTTCAFGGPAMNILYVATGREFSPGTGALYSAQMRVAARPVQVTVTKISTDDLINPADFEFVQNYPNPFNAATMIEYSLAKPAHVRIAIYDVLGRHVCTLVDESKIAGNFKTTWNGISEENVPASTDMYFCRLETNNVSRGAAKISGQEGQGFVKVIKLALVR